MLRRGFHLLPSGILKVPRLRVDDSPLKRCFGHLDARQALPFRSSILIIFFVVLKALEQVVFGGKTYEDVSAG